VVYCFLRLDLDMRVALGCILVSRAFYAISRGFSKMPVKIKYITLAFLLILCPLANAGYNENAQTLEELNICIIQMKQFNEKYYNGDGDGHQFDATAKDEFLAGYNEVKAKFKTEAQHLP